jgi:hypothetical protein
MVKVKNFVILFNIIDLRIWSTIIESKGNEKSLSKRIEIENAPKILYSTITTEVQPPFGGDFEYYNFPIPVFYNNTQVKEEQSDKEIKQHPEKIETDYSEYFLSNKLGKIQ